MLEPSKASARIGDVSELRQAAGASTRALSTALQCSHHAATALQQPVIRRLGDALADIALAKAIETRGGRVSPREVSAELPAQGYTTPTGTHYPASAVDVWMRLD
jgi:hypothetical protein